MINSKNEKENNTEVSEVSSESLSSTLPCEPDEEMFKELCEKDFYPPEDTRTIQSNVYDIFGGDNFVDFTEYYFEYCDEEERFDS